MRLAALARPAFAAGVSLSVPAACALPACGGGAPGEEALDVYVPGPLEEAGADATVAPVEGGSAPIDRAGHPLVAVMLVPGTLDDSFNAQPSFGPEAPRVLQDAIESRLLELDTLVLGEGADASPDPVDWPIPEGGTHPLLPAFVADTLLVDTGLSCLDADGGFAKSYFDLDRQVYLGSLSHSTCGGRTPGEDVVSETLSLLVTNGRASVSQGVAGPTKPAPMSFPYLAGPN